MFKKQTKPEKKHIQTAYIQNSMFKKGIKTHTHIQAALNSSLNVTTTKMWKKEKHTNKHTRKWRRKPTTCALSVSLWKGHNDYSWTAIIISATSGCIAYDTKSFSSPPSHKSTRCSLYFQASCTSGTVFAIHATATVSDAETSWRADEMKRTKTNGS